MEDALRRAPSYRALRPDERRQLQQLLDAVAICGGTCRPLGVAAPMLDRFTRLGFVEPGAEPGVIICSHAWRARSS